RHRHRLALRSRRPAPGDQGVVRHVIDQLGDATLAIALAVEQRAAQRGAALVLPTHRQRGEVPVGRAGYAARAVVGPLMAGGATHPDGALVVGAALDVHLMTMAVVALLRVVDR